MGDGQIPVRCRQCGEEVLGAANRCWKCAARLDAAQCRIPAQRRPSIPREAVRLATQEEVLAWVQFGHVGPKPGATGRMEELRLATDPALQQVRRGSPFAELAAAVTDSSLVAETRQGRSNSPDRPERRDASVARRRGAQGSYAATGGTIAAWVLALLALVAVAWSPYPAIPAVVAGLGLAMGIWGLYSRHRIAATVGILVCCLALALSGIALAYQFYEQGQGRTGTIQPNI